MEREGYVRTRKCTCGNTLLDDRGRDIDGTPNGSGVNVRSGCQLHVNVTRIARSPR